MRFILILLSLIIYTCFKAYQLFPEHLYLMILVVVFIFALMLGSMFLSRISSHRFDDLWFKALTWLGHSLIGFWSTYIMISIPVDILHFTLSFFNHAQPFLNHTVHLIVFGVATLMTLLGFLEVLRGPKIVNVDIPLPNLPKGLHDLKIAQISDLHIGPTIQSRYVRRVVEKTNATNPDIIVITGDLVDAHTASIKKHLLPLADLKASYGIYYVTGNHEYYWGIQSLLPELEKLGLTTLINANRMIEIQGSKILMAGITDPAGTPLPGHRPDLGKASECLDRPDVKILLAHRPDPYKTSEKSGYDLQFSGHTHAGQFFPFSLFIPLAHKYYRGLNRYEKLWLYVNPGTGYWGPANRFGIASEITLAKLLFSPTPKDSL